MSSFAGDCHRSSSIVVSPGACLAIAGFGAHTPLGAIDTAAVDSWRASLLVDRRLSPRSIQQLLTVLHGVAARAMRRGWIAVNRRH
jgi:hypothetical protein